MKMHIGTFSLLAGLTCLLVAEMGAIPTPQSCLAYLKDMALKKFKSGLEQTAVVNEFREAVQRIKEKYEQAAEQRLFDPENEVEAEKYYYQIALMEVKQMRESGFVAGKFKDLGEIQIPDGYACNRNGGAEAGGDDDADYDMMDMDLDDTGAESIGLGNKLEELEELNHQLESEMGWSMSPEARERMHKQARQLAREVLTNEVRDLAMAAVTGFMAGGVGGAVGPVWTVVSASLKIKVVKYFMQMLLDILSSYLGHSIELEKPPNSPPKAPAMDVDTPIAAAA